MTNRPDDGSPAAIHADHHADVSGGWLRAAVFGASDGLVSNFALIAGVVGGATAAVGDASITSLVILTGLAGLFAGAFSMATGEWVSVRTQNEMVHRELQYEADELRINTEAETAELAGWFADHGVDPDLALQVSSQISADTESALRIHARAELGLDPDSLPSPWVAASSSFAAFAIGAILPIVPFLFGASSLTPAAAAAAAGMFAAGALASLVTTQPWWFSGLRQLGLGAAAAMVTFWVGSLVGGSV